MSHIIDDGVGGRLKTKLRTLVVRGFFAIWLNFFFYVLPSSSFHWMKRTRSVLMAEKMNLKHWILSPKKGQRCKCTNTSKWQPYIKRWHRKTCLATWCHNQASYHIIDDMSELHSKKDFSLQWDQITSCICCCTNFIIPSTWWPDQNCCTTDQELRTVSYKKLAALTTAKHMVEKIGAGILYWAIK